MRDVMGPLPDTPPERPEVKLLDEAAFPRFIRRKITFASGDGDSFPPTFSAEGKAWKRARALCLHQTTSAKKNLPDWAVSRTCIMPWNWRNAASLPSRPTTRDLATTRSTPTMGYVSATMKGIRNHRRAIDLLASMPEVDDRRIGVIGHSLGGHNALFVAMFDPRIAAVVTSCGFTAFAKYYGGNLTGWSHAGYMPRIATVYEKSPQKMPFDFPGVLQALAPRFVFINAPTGDANFDVCGVEDCVKAAQPVYAEVFHAPRRLRVVHPECGHDFPPDIRTQAYDFLQTIALKLLRT